jgi:hypothetical protein
MTTEHNNNDYDASFRPGKHPSALSASDKPKSVLSVTSKMFDVDGDGQLDDAEKAMRDMDTDNNGYLTNDKVYKVMLEQMKLQQEVFGLKRIAMIFLAIVFILSLATLGTSFAAAMLAKDTDVKNGNLVAKDSGAVLGTSNVATSFSVTEGVDAEGVDGSGTRSLQNVFDSNSNIWITRADADKAWAECEGGGDVYLKRSCNGGNVLVDVSMCTGSNERMQDLTGPVYTVYTSTTSSAVKVKIDCTKNPCQVTFPSTPTPTACLSHIAMTPIDIGTAEDYVILSKAGISTVPSSAITGDIAVSPIGFTAMTGFGFQTQVDTTYTESTQITGKAFASNYAVPIPGRLGIAVLDMGRAYTAAAGRTNSDASRINLGAGLLGGVLPGGPTEPLTPGVYTFSTFVEINGAIHFQGSDTDVFVIQIADYLSLEGGINVTMDTTSVGTPQAKNIFWQVAGYTSVGTTVHMEGIILCATAVIFKTGSSLTGRILAQTAVTLDSATITEPPRVGLKSYE